MLKLGGPLWTMSCFAFESMNGVLKGHFHGTRDMCSQMVTNFNLSQLLPRMKALHDSSKRNLQHQSNSLNGEQVVLKGRLLSVVVEDVLTRDDIQHICQYLHLDAGNMEQWQWCFFTRALNGKDVFHSRLYKTKKLNNYTVLYKQDLGGSGLGEINFYFTLKLPTGDGFHNAMVTKLKGKSESAITGIELLDEHLKKRMIPVKRCSKMICINVQHIQCKCIPIHVGDECYAITFPNNLHGID